MSFLAYTGLLNFLSSATLAVVVFYRCPERKLAITYGLVNVAIAFFSIFYFFWQISPTASLAFFNLRGLSLSSLWINQAFLFFVLTFLGSTSRARWVVRMTFILSIVFSYLLLSGALFATVEARYGFGYWGNVTRWFSVYLVFWHFELLYAFALLVQSFRNSSGARRNQLKYMLVAFSVGYLGGVTNWPLWFNIDFPPYATCFISVYCAVMAYAIVKHQLLDIHVVIKRTLIYSIVSASLIAIYASVVTLIAWVLQGHVGAPSAYSAAIAAGVITLLFDPLRNRIQRFIDERFSRTRIDREGKLMQFSNQIVDQQDLEQTTYSLSQILSQSLNPKAFAIYSKSQENAVFNRIYREGDLLFPESLPLGFSIAPMIIEGVHEMMPLTSRREALGYLLLGEKRSELPYSEEDRVLLRLLANQAALAYERPRLLHEVSSSLVHEIKMPMANITLPAELTFMQIEETLKQKGSAQELLPKIQARMKYIMDQAILASHRVDALQQMNDSSGSGIGPVDLIDVIENSLGVVQEMTTQQRVSIEKHVQNTALQTQGNAEQLKIVLTNLLKNAIEAMAENGDRVRCLTLKAETHEDQIVLEISDTGPGVPDSDRGLIFQSHYSTKGAHGSGMGLFLTRQIIRAHDGNISVNRNDGKTTFRIQLPWFRNHVL